MSAKATFWAWHQPIKPATAKLVLLCLADCHNGDSGQCNPSITYIAKQTGLNKKTVMAGLDKLEELGVIESSKMPGSSTQYHLLTSTEIGSTENGTGTENGSTEIGTNQYQKRYGGSTKNGTQTYKEPKKNLNTGNSRLQIPDSASEFESEIAEFIQHRKNIKKPLTQDALSRFVTTASRVAGELGLTPGRVVTEVIDAGWQSVQTEWLRNRLNITNDKNTQGGYY